jgi:Ricin-type beta-trefoil lectin domain
MFARRIWLALASLAALAGFSILPAAAASAAPAVPVVTYTDTGFVVTGPENTCSGLVPAGLSVSGSVVTESGTADALTLHAPGAVTFTAAVTGGNNTLTVTGNPGSAATTVTVNETYGTGCVSAETFALTGVIVSGGTAAPVSIPFPVFTYVVGGVQFAGAPSGGSFAFAGLPAGVVTSSGELVLDGSNAHPGLYTSVGVSYTGLSGAEQTDSFGLLIKATATRIPQTRTYGPGTVVGSNGFCLDARNLFGTEAPATLQIWKCGAAGGTDQEFVYSTADHTLRYSDSTGRTDYCVTSPGVDEVATLALCGSTPASSQTVTYDDGIYRFSSNGTVLDNAGLRKVDGNRVLSWVFNGGVNQVWSLPE